MQGTSHPADTPSGAVAEGAGVELARGLPHTAFKAAAGANRLDLPKCRWREWDALHLHCVPLEGVEPPTSTFVASHSILLSYSGIASGNERGSPDSSLGTPSRSRPGSVSPAPKGGLAGALPVLNS